MWAEKLWRHQKRVKTRTLVHDWASTHISLIPETKALICEVCVYGWGWGGTIEMKQVLDFISALPFGHVEVTERLKPKMSARPWGWGDLLDKIRPINTTYWFYHSSCGVCGGSVLCSRHLKAPAPNGTVEKLNHALAAMSWKTHCGDAPAAASTHYVKNTYTAHTQHVKATQWCRTGEIVDWCRMIWADWHNIWGRG